MQLKQRWKRALSILSIFILLFLFLLIWAGTNIAGITLPTARLGGTMFPFLLSFGIPTNTIRSASTLIFTNHVTGTAIIITTATPCSVWYRCINSRIVSITAIPAKAKTWSIDTARVICRTFTPLDSQFIVTLPPQNILEGDEMRDIYLSKSLAKQFPVSDFHDENGMTTEPGIYKLALHYGFDVTSSTPISLCWLALGKSVQ